VSFVYLIAPQDWSLNRIKIGYTSQNPYNRLSALQTGCPFPLSVVAFFKANPSFERVLHSAFAPLRETGEWFRLEGKLLAFVSQLFFDGYGARMATDAELWRALEYICEEEPTEGFCTYEEWHASAQGGEIETWMCDVVWAELKRNKAQ
jgi:hypothetical protein